MVDSGASSNVMPWSVYQKINAEVEPSSLKIIQLDGSDVKVIDELKNVLIRLSSNPKIHQVIDIIVVDIPEVYGLFLSRDWSEKLQGYFATDWSHLWLLENGKPNKSRVNRERYLKFTVTDLNDPNEPYTPPVNPPEVKGMDTYFGNFMAEFSPINNPEQKSEILACTQPTTSIQQSCEPDGSQIWSLYFDGSKSKEGAGAGCIIIDPAGNKTLLACRLEFECTNNIAEYEALLQGLRKALDMHIQNLIVFGDSEIVVRQVRDSIHCLSPHLKCYQSEVWSLMKKISAFNINSIPRSNNVEADLLANVASKLLPADGLSPNAFSVELLFRPSIPDNITNCRVFDDDQQIINFLHMEETFQGAVIDEQMHDENLHDFTVIPNPKSPEALSDMVNLSDISFRGLINHSIVVYLDDVIVYSKNKDDHLAHLRSVLLRCRKYRISLNPKKSIFAVEQGKLLGFIVSSDGMIIDPERTQVIAKLPPPTSKKSMQSFLGQINFVRRFVPSFSEMVRPLQNLIKKDTQYHWGPTENQAFNDIKKAIIDALSLMSPDFSQDFTLYTFASDRSYATVLTQKNSENNEVPIAFMSSTFKGAKLNYPAVDRQAYAVFKAVKHFQSYLLKSRMKVIVPYPAVRNLLVKKELGEKRANWVTSLQEYDLEITPAHIVRGQGLCKLVVDSETKQQEDSGTLDLEQRDQNLICCAQNLASPWYDDIRFCLEHGSTPHYLDPAKRRALRLKYASFHLVNGILFRQNFDGVLMRCLEKDEAEKVLLELHAGEAGGHFGGDTTAHKVLRAGYY
jgi:ribonuclease HI